MAYEYIEVKMSDIEDPVSSPPLSSNYYPCPSSYGDDFVNNFDVASDNDNEGPIQGNSGEIINGSTKKFELEMGIERH